MMKVHLMAVHVKVSDRLNITPMPTSTAVMAERMMVTMYTFLRIARPCSSLWWAFSA